MATLLEQLPEDWAARGAEQKVQFFNEKNWTPEQLLGAGAGITQADIDWMRQNAGYTVGLSSPSTPSTSIVDRFTGASDYSQQDLISDTTSAPVNQFTYGDVTLPSDWYGKTAGQKVQFFNEQNLTPEQLLGAGAGLTQADIDWMRTQGYTGGVSEPAYSWTGQAGVGGDFSSLPTEPAKNQFQSAVLPWLSQGVQNIGGTIYQPNYESVPLGHGEEGGQYGKGALQNVLRYKEGQTAPGQTYEILDPTTGQVTGTGKFKEVGGAFDLLKEVAADLAPILQFTPLAPLVQVVNAISAIESGNVAQGIASLAGAGQGLGLGDFSTIRNLASTAAAIENKDPLAALSAGMNLTGTKEIGGFNTKDLAAAGAVVQGLQTGNVAQALAGAGQLTGSPNIALAGAAVNMIEAAKSGNPAAMLRAGEALTGAINNAQNQAAINQAYQDPTRALDTVLGGDIRGAGLTTTVGAEDLTPEDLAAIVNPPGQVATTSAPTGSATTSTFAPSAQTDAAATTIDTSRLPAFNRASITTLPQSRAAEIIAEMYPGQSLDWVNQAVLNAAASHIRADDEAGLRSRLALGQSLGTGDAISGDMAVDYRAPAGTRVAQPGENAGLLGYTETGTPVNLIQQFGTTAKRMTPEEAFAYDVANAGESIDPLTGQPYEVSSSPEALALANVIRGPVSSVAAGVGEQAKLLGVAGGWITGDRDNAIKQWGSNVESWANSITPDSVKKGQDQISKSISEADGLPAKAWAAVTGAATNPLATLHWIGKEAIQEVLPLGSAITVGRTVSSATKLKYGEELAQRFGLTAAIGTDATMNAGESATASYEEVYNTLRDKGISEDKASSAAAAAAAGSGAVTLFTAAIGDAALVKQLMNNIKGATINATLKEGPTEFAEGALQSVVEDNATNVALGKGLVFDPDKALTSGTLEALIGSGTTATISKGADVFTPAVETGASSSQSTAPSTPAAPATAALAAQTKVEPTFDPNTVVATYPDTGDAVTLGDLTGASIRDAGTSTRIDPTLEALEGAGLDNQQIISDYVSEVLGGSAPNTGADQDVVIGTDPDTGAEVTLGDLGLTGPETKAPVTTDANTVTTTAPTTTTPITTSPTTIAANTPVAIDAQSNTLTVEDIDAAPSTALATPATTTAPDTKVAPDTTTAPEAKVTQDTTTSPDTTAPPDTQPGIDTKAEPKAPSDAQPATEPKLDTEPKPDTELKTEQKPDTQPDTQIITEPKPDTQPEVKTEPKVDPNARTTVTPKVTSEPPPPPEEDVFPSVTEEELRQIVSAPTPATPTTAPPAPTPAPRAPAPSPAPAPLAQLPPAQQAAVAQLLQEIFQAPEADLLEMFAELSEQREKKRKERGIADLLKSRKA